MKIRKLSSPPMRIGDDRVCNSPASYFESKLVGREPMRIGDDRVCNSPTSFFESSKDISHAHLSNSLEREILSAKANID